MKQPLALILTDTHLSISNIELVKDIWQQAINKCKELNIKRIYFAGDFFNSRNAQPLDVLTEGLDIVRNVKKSKIELFMIPGNHDKVSLDSERSYLDIFESYCHLYKKTTGTHEDGVSVYFIPYFKEKGKYPEQLQLASDMAAVPINKINVLITHVAVNGVKNNDGSKQENDLDINLFKSFDTVLVGHFHNQSKLGDSIYYIGSAYQSNFGEDTNKGFTILYNDGSHEFVKSIFPEYIKLTANISDTKKIKEIQKQYANSKDNIRIVLTGDETQLASLNKEKFSSIGIDVKFDKEVIRQDLSAVLETNTNFNRSNIKEAFEQFCLLNDYQDKEVGINYLEKLSS